MRKILNIRGRLAKLAVLALLSSPAAAGAGGIPATAEPGVALDQQIESQIWPMLERAVQSGRNSAVLLTYVRDGQILSRHAAGLENPESSTPVTTSGSMLRLASISKTFVAVTLAQLVTRGRIRSYDDPANSYLQVFQLPGDYGSRVTLSQLATHSAGFDEVVFGMSAAAPTQGAPSATDFRDRLPKFFAAPGSVAAYSNYGVDLLGAVVADVSGKPYARYLQEEVLTPLGMTRTVSAYPPGGIDHLLTAFHPADRTNVQGFDYPSPLDFPASGIFSTAEDMAKFMIALLGPADGQSAITPQMRADLFRPRQRNGPASSPSGHGLVFEVVQVGSRSLVLHRGGGPVHCTLALMPWTAAGVFYCLTAVPPRGPSNADQMPLDRFSVDRALLDVVARGAASDKQPLAVPQGSSRWDPKWEAYTGDYLSTQRHHFGIGRLLSMLHPSELHVGRGDRGLIVDGIDNLIEVSAGEFESPGGGERFAFFTDQATGRRMLAGSLYSNPSESASWLDRPRVALGILAGVMAISATGLPWLVSRRRFRAGGTIERFAILCLPVCLFAIPVVIHELRIFGDHYFVGDVWPVVVLRVLAFAIIPPAVLLTIMSLRNWQRKEPGFVPALFRAHVCALAVTAWVAVAALINLGLIGLMIR